MSSQVLNQTQDDMPLPALREDLKIEASGCFINGAPSWLIHDPFRNQFFRIGKATFELLSVWHETTLSSFCKFASQYLKRPIEKEEVDEVTKFLFANQLTQNPVGGNYQSFVGQEESRKKAWALRLFITIFFSKFHCSILNPCWM